MVRYIARSLIQAIAVALGIATLTFLIVHVSGDPTQHLLPPNATKEDIRVLKEAMGFDRPLLEQTSPSWLARSAAISADRSGSPGRPSIWSWSACPTPSC